VALDVSEGNMEAHRRLKKKLELMLSTAGAHAALVGRNLRLVHSTLTIIANALRVGKGSKRRLAANTAALAKAVRAAYPAHLSACCP